MLSPTIRLSVNFTLGEFLRSDTAERDPALKALQENPTPGVVANLERLTRRVLQPIRTALGTPIHITSGYRHPLLNKLVGSVATSQHCLGEAADCVLSPAFLTDPHTEDVRTHIETRVRDLTGRPVPIDANASFYLFAFVCLDLDRFDIDQLIHEYGDGYGRPAWVHLSASAAQDRREACIVGRYTSGEFVQLRPAEALAWARDSTAGPSRA